ncbi:MAG: flagellar protein FlgN [Roseburia sp.]|nr:flagellar protein FlgN [Roseburia sp.]MCM1278421.1 flagellar protein FlgN [Robinsoniella sp.]
MASLMENLMDTLEEEQALYEELLQLSMNKTPILIKGDTVALQKITDEEQDVIDKINHLDKTRQEVMKDIANVINKDVDTLRIIHLIQMLEKRPTEQKRLSSINDRLKETVDKMRRCNERNKALIESSLEMVAFDLNLIQSMKSAPETANYNKGALNAGSMMGPETGSFDAKQ